MSSVKKHGHRLALHARDQTDCSSTLMHASADPVRLSLAEYPAYSEVSDSAVQIHTGKKKQRFYLNDRNSDALQASLFDDSWKHCIRSQSSQFQEYLRKTVSSDQLVLGTSISLTSRAVASSFSLATLPAVTATTVVRAVSA